MSTSRTFCCRRITVAAVTTGRTRASILVLPALRVGGLENGVAYLILERRVFHLDLEQETV